MKNEFMNVPIFSGDGIIHFEERKIPIPGDNQLLIQSKANLLCGSDRNQFYMAVLNVFQDMKELVLLLIKARIQDLILE